MILAKLHINNASSIINQSAKFYSNLPTQTIATTAFVRLPHNVNCLHCVSKNPRHFQLLLKTNHQILNNFGTNISDTACHQITIQFSTSTNVCFCTTWKSKTSKISLFIKCDMIA